MTAAALVLALLALGAPSEDSKSIAARLLAEGNEAFAAGRAAEALTRYRAAYDAYPSPKIQMNIGEAHLALGQRVAAARAFHAVVDSVPPESPVFAAADKRLAELDAFLGRLTVTSAPEAKLRLDGEERGTTPLVGAILEAGAHDLELNAPDHVKHRRRVTVEAGRSATVAVTLESVPALVPPVQDREPPNDGVAWWVWAGAGVAAAAAVVAVIVIAAGGGDDFVPGGELGRTSLDEWSMR